MPREKWRIWECSPLPTHCNEGNLKLQLKNRGVNFDYFSLGSGWKLWCTWHWPTTHLLIWDPWWLQNHGGVGSHAVNERDNREWFLHGGKCIFDLQSDTLLAENFSGQSHCLSSTLHSKENFPHTRRHAQKILYTFKNIIFHFLQCEKNDFE